MPVKKRIPKRRQFNVTEEILETFRLAIEEEKTGERPVGCDGSPFFKLFGLCGLDLSEFAPLPESIFGSYGVRRIGPVPDWVDEDKIKAYQHAQHCLREIEAALKQRE